MIGSLCILHLIKGDPLQDGIEKNSILCSEKKEAQRAVLPYKDQDELQPIVHVSS